MHRLWSRTGGVLDDEAATATTKGVAGVHDRDDDDHDNRDHDCGATLAVTLGSVSSAGPIGTLSWGGGLGLHHPPSPIFFESTTGQLSPAGRFHPWSTSMSRRSPISTGTHPIAERDSRMGLSGRER